MKLMLNTGEKADVHFLVGEKKELLPAHKRILECASDVFEAMFRFDSQNGKAEKASADSPIVVPDIEAEVFRVMLSFIYAQDSSGLNGHNAMALLYAAKKYNISGLIKACLDYPIGQLSNVFLAIDHARFLSEHAFALRCLDFIDQNAKILLQSEEFAQIDQNMLCEILGSDQLRISDELTIWNSALRWADEKCRQKAIECSAANLRSALGPALFKIRFPLITYEEFTQNIVPSGVLTPEESVGICQFHLPGLLSPVAFPSHARISAWNNTPKGNAGTLALEITKFSRFARRDEGNCRLSKGKVHIKALPWKICAKINTTKNENGTTEKCLGFFLRCSAPREDTKWNCKCSATFRIISQMRGTEHLIGKRNDHIFNNKMNTLGFSNFITFSHLMDQEKGFYDKNEDKVTLAIDVIVKEQNAEKLDYSNPNKTNGKIVMEIGKLSEFSREICLSERSSEIKQIKEFQWKILALIINQNNKSSEKCLAFYLLCAGSKSENWNCKCSATIQIVSQKGGAENLIGQFNGRIFNNKLNNLGFPTFITFAQLMDPSRGFYDKDGDKVTLAVDVAVEEQKGTKRKLSDE
ncbi:hypothetical protein niasHS_017071 [Heterodera schachtii]|uniref:BTB domain-containing protein n=1 Tax=Heterodera schachtii TaxID=97005 RepID=A0ABD2HYY5_HETSC